MAPMIVGLILSFVGGLVVGGLYFAGLWMTVSHLSDARRPMLLLAGSALVRLALLLGAIYLIMDGRWERLMACVLGVLVARTAILVWRRRLPARPNPDRRWT